EGRAIGDASRGYSLPGTPAHLRKLGLERLVAWVRWVEGIKGRGRVLGLGDLGDDVGRLGRRQVVDDVGADPCGVNAPDLGVTRIGQDRIGELDVRLSEGVGALSERLEIRGRIVTRVEPVFGGSMETGNYRLGARRRRAVFDPQRGMVPRRIERFD